MPSIKRVIIGIGRFSWVRHVVATTGRTRSNQMNACRYWKEDHIEVDQGLSWGY